jgi:hypothetical protein
VRQTAQTNEPNRMWGNLLVWTNHSLYARAETLVDAVAR